MPSVFTSLFRQTDAVSPIEFSTNNTTWTSITSWPFYIGNELSNNSSLRIKLTTNITLPNGETDYFVLTANNIIIDGNNKTITVADFPNFPGLITNGTATENGNDNIIVKNVVIASVGTTSLLSGQGWICKNYFGKGSTGNIIQNCSSNGSIPANSGGITGRYTANVSSNFTITGCSASGSILDGAAGANAGGIVGPNSGPFTISNCTYNGNINGNGSGGIIGASTSNVSISYCSSSGIIKCGGIAGDYTGINGKVTITYCFSKGDIGSMKNTPNVSCAGGIVGAYSGILDVTKCYSTGAIGGQGKNDCGGIVGGYAAAGTGGGVVVIQSCFSLGNIHTNCGGIAAKYFGYNSYQRCNIFDSYSIGDIGENAGGIAGPEWAAGVTLATCYISSCYSLGILRYSSSGGIIAPTTVAYPTDKHTVQISNCFNSFSNIDKINNIVGLGHNGISFETLPSTSGTIYSTIPSKQTVIRGGSTTINDTIKQQIYSDIKELNSKESKETAIELSFPYYYSISSTNSQSIVKLTNGYYTVTQDIIRIYPFNKLILLGYTVSDFLQNAGFSPNDLITYNIYLNSTVDYFKESIGLADLFVSNYSLSLLAKIGYNVTEILAVNPNIPFKDLINAGFNFKKNNPPYTIDDMIASTVEPALSSLDIYNAGFKVFEIKAQTDARFTLTNMRDDGVPVKFLLGANGYLLTDLKAAGFNTEAFRLAGYDPYFLNKNGGFTAEEFQGSKFPIKSFSKTDTYGTTWLFEAETMISIGFDVAEVVANGIFASGDNIGTRPIETYIKREIPIKYIPKTTQITGIGFILNTSFSSDPNNTPYKPINWLNNGWTHKQVSEMGFFARQLLDSGRFTLSDLKTAGYTNTEMFDSGHAIATIENIAKATILKRQNPFVIESIITDTTNIYVYFNESMNNVSRAPIAIGYSLDIDAADFDFMPYKTSPLIIPNVDFNTDKYFHIITYNGKYSISNSCSIAKYLKPVPRKVKSKGLKLSVALDKLSAYIGSGISDVEKLTGTAIMDSIAYASVSNVEGGWCAGQEIKGIAQNTQWDPKKWSFFPSSIKKLASLYFNAIDENLNNTISTLYNEGKSIYNSIVTKSEILGSNYALTDNDVFLFSTLTITNIVAENLVCKVYFTGSINHNETVTDIYYTLDNGVSWISSDQTTSPLTITGEFSINSEVSISIRYYKQTTMVHDNDAGIYNICAMNYAFSQATTLGDVTFPVKIGKFGDVSNTFSVKMLYSAVPPTLIHVQYNPKAKSNKEIATCFIHQDINCAGNIRDYKWSTDGGTTWNSANLNLSAPLEPLSFSRLGLNPKSYALKKPIRQFQINVGNRPSISVIIKAVLDNGVDSPINNIYYGLKNGIGDQTVTSAYSALTKKTTTCTASDVSIANYFSLDIRPLVPLG